MTPAGMMSVVSPVPDTVWTEIFDMDMRATPFQTRAWMSGICADGKHADESRLYMMADNRIILPLAVRHPLPGLSIAESLPDGFGAGGLICEKAPSAADFRAIIDDLRALSYTSIRLRPNPLWDLSFAAAELEGWSVKPRCSHILALDGSFDGIGTERIGGEKRNKIRKAIKAGVSLEQGNSKALIDTFYAIYMRWCEARARRRGLPPALARTLGRRREPYAKFARGADAMAGGFTVFVAWHRGFPVAAAILLVAGRSAVYWRGASDPTRAGPVAANDFLQGSMIEHACKAGCQFYHMGESGGIASLEQFKESFGARAYPYSEFVFEGLPIARSQRLLEAGYGRLAAILTRRTHHP